jgi:hypothetical protein
LNQLSMAARNFRHSSPVFASAKELRRRVKLT